MGPFRLDNMDSLFLMSREAGPLGADYGRLRTRAAKTRPSKGDK
mgnify:FL=1